MQAACGRNVIRPFFFVSLFFYSLYLFVSFRWCSYSILQSLNLISFYTFVCTHSIRRWCTRKCTVAKTKTKRQVKWPYRPQCTFWIIV
jgi:hypothetical protein